MSKECDARTVPGPFHRDCAFAALVGAREASQSCGDFTKSAVHVKTTFGPTGKVEAATVDVPDVEPKLSSCIEERFRSIHVPPFIGSSTTVGISVR